MTWETFPCCCNRPSCLCRDLYTTMTAKWTGSVTFRPLECREYWRRWANDPASLCGNTARLVLPSIETFGMDSIIVPQLSSIGCSSTACRTYTRTVQRYFASFVPFPGSPEYFDPQFRCQYDTLDSPQSPYQLQFNHSILVRGPQTNPSSGSPIPKWEVQLRIGSVSLWFVSTGPDFSCLPQEFEWDPTRGNYDPNACHGPCTGDGCPQGSQNFSCVILNPPPFGFPGGSAGSPLAHEITVDIGRLVLG